MKNWTKITLLSLLILLFCSTGARGDSLMKESEGFCDLYGSRTASKVGDIITIVFNEKTVSNQTAKGKLKHTYEVGAEQGQGFLESFLGLGMSGGETTDVEQSTTQQHSLSTTVTVSVVEVLPNGLLKIEGRKNLQVNHENQEAILTGYVRPQDITASNTVDSTKVSNITAQINGLPIDKSLKKRRGGIIRWVWGLLF